MNAVYKRWDIWLADVPFEALPGALPESKVRPVLILDKETATVLGLKMTGHSPRAGEYAVVHWKAAGLHKPTTVRISKQLKLPETCILKKIGRLSPADIVGVQKAIIAQSK